MKPELGAVTPLHNEIPTFEPLMKLGLSCTQIVSWNMEIVQSLDNARAIKKKMKDLGIRLSSFWGGYDGPVEWNFTQGPVSIGLVPPALRERRIQQLKRWADFAAELEAPALVTHAGFLPENGTDPEFLPVVMAIKEVAEHCKKRGIGFWFETGQETPVALLRAMKATGADNLGINLDPANLILYGKGNPIDALDVFGSYVRSVHVKDGVPPTCSEELGHEVLVGTGSVRFPEFIPKLLSCGFDGDLIIEREIEGEQQQIDIQKTITYVQELLNK